jgi:hypothetical protein
VTPLDQAGSLALGCALAAVLAALAAIVVVPAWLGALARANRAGEAPEQDIDGSSLVAWIASSRVGAVAALIAAVAALAALAAPLLESMSSPFATQPAPAIPIELAQDSLLGELPIPAAIAAGICAVVAIGATRRPLLLFSGALPPLVAAAGIGATAFVFDRGDLVDVLGFDQRDSLDTEAVAIAACALLAIAAGRGASALIAARDQRRLALAGPEVAEQAATLTLPPAGVSTLVGVVAAGAMMTVDLHPAQELGFALAAGLLFDLILARAPLLALAGRRIG